MKTIRVVNLVILTIFTILIFAGCDVADENIKTNENEQAAESEVLQSNQGIIQFFQNEIEISLENFFPTQDNFIMKFLANDNISYVEKIVHREFMENGINKVVIEGLPETGGKSLPYFLEYEISDYAISNVIGDTKSDILKKPVFYGASWETIFFDEEYGKFSGEAKIVRCDENFISVEIRPLTPSVDGIPDDFKVV